jgi:RNA recognition motif-containing protein
MCQPTSTLHFSNIGSKGHVKIKEHDLREICSKFGTVEAIRVSDKPKPMALVRLSNLSDAVACLSAMHNQTIKGHTMKIAFSRQNVNGSAATTPEQPSKQQQTAPAASPSPAAPVATAVPTTPSQ